MQGLSEFKDFCYKLSISLDNETQLPRWRPTRYEYLYIYTDCIFENYIK